MYYANIQTGTISFSTLESPPEGYIDVTEQMESMNRTDNMDIKFENGVVVEYEGDTYNAVQEQQKSTDMEKLIALRTEKEKYELSLLSLEEIQAEITEIENYLSPLKYIVIITGKRKKKATLYLITEYTGEYNEENGDRKFKTEEEANEYASTF